MAYLGSTTRRAGTPAGAGSGRATRASRTAREAPYDGPAATATRASAERAPRAVGRSYEEEHEWARLATFGGGIALGALLGAGIALLFAPAAGEETREYLLDHARSAGGLVRDRVGGFRDDARYAARRGRRRVRRGLARSGWALEDALDRTRRLID